MNEKFGHILWQDNKLLLSFSLFHEMNKHNITFEQLNTFLEDYIKFRNSFFVGSPSNSEIYLHKNKEYFAFGIYDNEFCLWHNNYNSLGSIKIDIKQKPTEEFCNWLQTKIDNCLKGFVNCSDCGKIIKTEEIAGRYFAGRYCKDCWEKTWQVIEAKETYD